MRRKDYNASILLELSQLKYLIFTLLGLISITNATSNILQIISDQNHLNSNTLVFKHHPNCMNSINCSHNFK